MSLSIGEIEERLEEAAYTLRHVRVDRGPRGYGSSWPDVVRSAFTAYGADAGGTMRVVPSASAISRMEECIGWLRLLEDADDRRLVWLKAEGVAWKPICYRIGKTRQTAWRHWVAALTTIKRKLAAAEKARGNRRCAWRADRHFRWWGENEKPGGIAGLSAFPLVG